jgi:hypothetical protein
LKGSYKVEGSFCDFRKHMVFFVKMGGQQGWPVCGFEWTWSGPQIKPWTAERKQNAQGPKR